MKPSQKNHCKNHHKIHGTEVKILTKLERNQSQRERNRGNKCKKKKSYENKEDAFNNT